MLEPVTTQIARALHHCQAVIVAQRAAQKHLLGACRSSCCKPRHPLRERMLQSRRHAMRKHKHKGSASIRHPADGPGSTEAPLFAVRRINKQNMCVMIFAVYRRRVRAHVPRPPGPSLRESDLTLCKTPNRGCLAGSTQLDNGTSVQLRAFLTEKGWAGQPPTAPMPGRQLPATHGMSLRWTHADW